MSARDEIVESLAFGLAEGVEEAKSMVDAYAHELAEKIRSTELPDDYVDMFENGTLWSADLIDPEVSP